MDETRPNDESIALLEQLFAHHPAWLDAARRIRDDVTSKVFFSHRPGEPWHLERRSGRTLLRPGPADRPDFAFRFTPGSIARLAAVEGGIAGFALELFGLIAETDPDLRVDLRVISPLPLLVRKGYLRLLLAAGPRVLVFGARHGVSSLSALRRIVRESRAAGPAEWEVDA